MELGVSCEAHMADVLIFRRFMGASFDAKGSESGVHATQYDINESCAVCFYVLSPWLVVVRRKVDVVVCA